MLVCFALIIIICSATLHNYSDGGCVLSWGHALTCLICLKAVNRSCVPTRLHQLIGSATHVAHNHQSAGIKSEPHVLCITINYIV